MNVIDRYLLAVKVFLPRRTQKDIIAELSEDIHSRIDDREAALRRPLTVDEQESLIAEFGHPVLLAGRYGPRRHLIGAEVFPFYWLVLRVALGIGVAVQVALALVMFAGGRTGQAIRQVAVVLPGVAWVQFGVITLAFAALDACGLLARVTRQWSPRTLPAPTGRVQPAFQLIVFALIAAWWFAALRHPALIFGPAAAVMAPAPIWQSLYPPMLLLALADIAIQFVSLVRPQWTRFRSLVRIVLTSLGLVVLYVLVRAGEWVVIADAARQSDSVQRAVETVNRVALWSFPFVAAVLVAIMLMELHSMRRAASSMS